VPHRWWRRWPAAARGRPTSDSHLYDSVSSRAPLFLSSHGKQITIPDPCANSFVRGVEPLGDFFETTAPSPAIYTSIALSFGFRDPASLPFEMLLYIIDCQKHVAMGVAGPVVPSPTSEVAIAQEWSERNPALRGQMERADLRPSSHLIAGCTGAVCGIWQQ
jgi:hypothetical protein